MVFLLSGINFFVFMEIRTGIGYDAHRLAKGELFVVGGVIIENDLGIVAHSDGDVLVHAIIDSLLGASGLGDIGSLFPSTDNVYKGADSLVLLKRVNDLINREGLFVLNIDSTVVVQEPKLSPYREQMRCNISGVLNIDVSRVSVKFTTTDFLGFEGAKQGVSAQAVCLLSR
jgi:2-C-methyl-D-erythritol 2,4-cyclodiphosphate synthase